MTIESQEAPSRLRQFIARSAAATEADHVVKLLAEELDADLVSLQTLSPDDRLVAVSWYASSEALAARINLAASEGALEWTAGVPEVLDAPVEARGFGQGERPGISPFRDLPADAWLEHVSITNAEGRLRGVVTVIGTPPGCPPLRDDERLVIAHACGLALVAASEAWRAGQLDSRLDALTQISAALASRTTIVDRLRAAVAVAQEATGFESIQLLTWDPTGHDLLLNVLYIRNVGFVPDRTWDRMTRDEIEASSQRFLEDPAPLIIADPAELESTPRPHRRWMRANGIQFLVFIPLIFEGEHLGTLVITSRLSKPRTVSRIRSLEALNGHLAAILRLSLLLAQVEDAYERLQRSHRQTVETLALAAEMRDATTGQHLRHLERLSLAIGRRMGLSEEEQRFLGFGAVVHDVGKLHVPDSVLLKRAALTEQELRVMRVHPEAGERILAQSDVPEPVCQIVRWHHERWDGSGYPDGLAGNRIPRLVQIVTVADVFDALVSRRPYKDAWSYDEALAEIVRSSGTQLSPDVVEVFLEIVPGYWAGQQLDLAA